MKIGIFLGKKQAAWLEQFKLVAETWSKDHHVAVDVTALDMSSTEALEAGGYDLVLHKLVTHIALEKEDELLAAELRRLEDFFDCHPGVSFEPVQSIRDVTDRRVVARKLEDFCVQTLEGRVVHPPFHEAASLDEARALAAKVAFELPWVCKPFVADGVPESHNLGMIWNTPGLLEAPLPYIIQPFVNHGAQIIKAYILGDTVLQLRRPSLPNVSKRGPNDDGRTYEPFGRISNAPDAAKVLPDAEPAIPEALLRQAVMEVGSRLNLKLFGVDLIREEETGDYLIIDVNYLPGYYGVPNVFESFLDLFHAELQKRKSMVY